ncbi:hypothetical protein [Rubellicoccus peritrichatus]|uniref:Predicted 3'-5' exonuclease PolB-like domain-containing protein n=1 Tax=Rubellicoccus peritrichatus TaxID=3080537 RepID=A0AAQ3LF15_9BACT|nr:hypothetical protein [Puniceicoccus sp. CR14]WOO42478.1 hypothetical protein RZN69_05205 [Puniceicoccus sp. CR14]
MFKTVQPNLLSFDIEWIPDPVAAQRLYGVKLDGPASEHDAFKRLWAEGGATEEMPRPYLKTMLCRIVTIAGIFREVDRNGDVSLRLVSLPVDINDPEKCSEKNILDGFLRGIGRKKPQLVGYNSANADIPILMQRAVVHGMGGHGFGARPDKPWEGADYFSTAGDYSVDLAKALAWGANTPRLHEAATVSGIPGKVDTAGDQVWELYLKGQLGKIRDYNDFDAFTTHLLWARIARFGELLTKQEYEHEQKLVRELIQKEIDGGKVHLERYLKAWDALRG